MTKDEALKLCCYYISKATGKGVSGEVCVERHGEEYYVHDKSITA